MATLTLFYKEKDGSNTRVKYDNAREYFYKFNSVSKRVARFSKWFKSEPEVLVAFKSFWVFCEKYKTHIHTFNTLLEKYKSVLKTLESIEDPIGKKAIVASMKSGISKACDTVIGKKDVDTFKPLNSEGNTRSLLDKVGMKLYIFKDVKTITHVVLYNGYASKMTYENPTGTNWFTRLHMLDYLVSARKRMVRTISHCQDVEIESYFPEINRVCEYHSDNKLERMILDDVVNSNDAYKMYDIIEKRKINVRDDCVNIFNY